ncbi:MAG: hypothetical protein ACE5HQ_11000 [Gemmatimonadota bacterium]
MREAFAASLGVVGRFADVEELELPDLPFGAVAGTIIRAEASAAFEDLIDSGRVHELSAPEDRIKGYGGQVVLAKDYINALRARRKLQRLLDEALEPYDAVIGPTRSAVANPIAGRSPSTSAATEGHPSGGPPTWRASRPSPCPTDSASAVCPRASSSPAGPGTS